MIRVYTVCHSVWTFWMHYSMVEPHSSTVRVFTANFSDVRIFRIFTADQNDGRASYCSILTKTVWNYTISFYWTIKNIGATARWILPSQWKDWTSLQLGTAFFFSECSWSDYTNMQAITDDFRSLNCQDVDFCQHISMGSCWCLLDLPIVYLTHHTVGWILQWCHGNTGEIIVCNILRFYMLLNLVGHILQK